MRKISSLQFITILLCCKLFTVMTYIPDIDENGVVIIIAAVITTILQGILMIPIIAFYNKNNGESIFSFANSKNRILGITISILFLLTSLWALIDSMGDLSFFLEYCFSDTYASWAIIIIIAAASLYVAHTGISTLARTTGIIAVVTLISLILVLTGFEHHIDFVELNIAVKSPVNDVIKSLPKFISCSQELVAFIILMETLRNRPARTVYGFLSIKLFISVVSILAVVMVLGDYVSLSKLPFYTLSAFSQTKIIEHYEAFFMLFWTLCAIIKITLFTICSQYCIHQIFPKLNTIISEGCSLFIAAAITLPILLKEKWEAINFAKIQSLAMIILLAVIPLILLFFKKRKSN
ncbi:MAG: GerAB/ArcD/ProY family transporter [Ruminococcus sp.]|nr:GerAB/ArcD/ProY family transporter [Ruminococcus sp.]